MLKSNIRWILAVFKIYIYIYFISDSLISVSRLSSLIAVSHFSPLSLTPTLSLRLPVPVSPHQTPLPHLNLPLSAAPITSPIASLTPIMFASSTPLSATASNPRRLSNLQGKTWHSPAARQAQHQHNRGQLPRRLQRWFQGHEDHCQGGWQCRRCRWVASSHLWPLFVICNRVRWCGCGVLIRGSGFWVVVM